MAKRDYYEVLGVNKNATDDEIKSAFRKCAKQYHPDLHSGDKEAEDKFKEINEAYEVLSNKDKRAQYDNFGHAAFDPTMGGGQYSGGFGFDPEDIFSSIFGGFSGFRSGNSRSNGPVAGRTLRYRVAVSFEEAAFGVEKELSIPREELCDTCNGSGAKPGTTPDTCSRCGGSGSIRIQQNTMLGAFTTTQTCNVCHGTGKVVKDPCADCQGTGRIKRTKRIKINIPAGIDDGQIFSIHGQGEAGYNGGPAGDLQIEVTVKPHKEFVRRGFDLHLEMTVPFTILALGGEIQVPTLKGTVKYSIPSGTQPGTVFRLREQGIKRLNSSSHGDLLVKVAVLVPKHLNDDQKELVRQLAESLGDNVAAPDRGRKRGRKRDK